jgi:hypothetical protein
MRVVWFDWIYLVVAVLFAYFGCRSLYRSKSLNRVDLLWLIVAFVFLMKFLFHNWGPSN